MDKTKPEPEAKTKTKTKELTPVQERSLAELKTLIEQQQVLQAPLNQIQQFIQTILRINNWSEEQAQELLNPNKEGIKAVAQKPNQNGNTNSSA